MNDTALIIIAFIEGIALGIVFFGGLWLTVKKTLTVKVPWVLVLGSFIFRVAITLTGFYFIGSGNWQRLISCLIGFIAARFIIIHFARNIDKKHPELRKEVANEA